MNIGAHISSAKAIEENKYVKGNTFQIFISSPQMWRSPKPREDADMLQDFDGPIYVHLYSWFHYKSKIIFYREVLVIELVRNFNLINSWNVVFHCFKVQITN